MPELVKKYDNQQQPILSGGRGTIPMTYFNLIQLNRGECLKQQVPGFETVYLVMAGDCDIEVDGSIFKNVKRKDIWSQKADTVYAGAGATVKIVSHQDHTEIAVGGGQCAQKFAPFRIAPEAVKSVEVGSSAAKTHRTIHYIVGNNSAVPTGNIIINELFAEDGCWSGYPPHKHDAEEPPLETEFEELYHFRFNPENGFGGQFVFQPDGSAQCYLVKNGDTVLIDKGYHPTVYSPGHQGYMFVILVGKYQPSLIQHFKDEYAYLAKGVPGVQDMLDSYQKGK
jgi:5-deoxy-glucuronate isomerase